MSAILLKFSGVPWRVHGISTPEGIFFSVYDFINVVCHKDGTYGCQIWIRLNNGQFKFRLNATVAHLRGLPKKTRKPTPVMTMDELAILIEGLGKRVSVRFDFHRMFNDTYTLFKSGDRSMLEEIRKSPLFAAPVHKAPVQQPVLPPEPVLEAVGAKRMRDQEEVLFNLELQERQMAINERQIALQERILTLREKTLALQTMS